MYVLAELMENGELELPENKILFGGHRLAQKIQKKWTVQGLCLEHVPPMDLQVLHSFQVKLAR